MKRNISLFVFTFFMIFSLLCVETYAKKIQNNFAGLSKFMTNKKKVLKKINKQNPYENQPTCA